MRRPSSSLSVAIKWRGDSGKKNIPIMSIFEELDSKKLCCRGMTYQARYSLKREWESPLECAVVTSEMWSVSNPCRTSHISISQEDFKCSLTRWIRHQSSVEQFRQSSLWFLDVRTRIDTRAQPYLKDQRPNQPGYVRWESWIDWQHMFVRLLQQSRYWRQFVKSSCDQDCPWWNRPSGLQRLHHHWTWN